MSARRWGAALTILLAADSLVVAAQEPPRAPTVAEAEAMEARLRAAIQVSPTTASLHASLGELLRSQARLAEARDAFAEAVRLEPMDARHRLDLGRAHLALDEFVEAEVNFQWGTELDPLDPWMYAGLGEALLGQDRRAAAITALQRAAALDPQNAEVEALLATARSAPQSDGDDSGAASSLPQRATQTLTILFAIALSIAGLGLILPVAGAIIVLIAFVPRAIFDRRQD